MKTNAKEYLIEFADSQQDWLKALIYEAIETNGNISNEKEQQIFENLSSNNKLTINRPNINVTNTDTEIIITQLKHINGVNALKSNQTIKFQKDINIIYGLNGAGKSSYFKILNEIVGGNQKKDILPNINYDTPQIIEVEISYGEKGTSNKSIIQWDGKSRSLNLLNKCKVFDSSYLSGLLGVRTADETLIQPLGLNLFIYIVEFIDLYKRNLLEKADKKRLEKPNIESKYLSQNIRDAFDKHTINKLLKESIEKLYVFSAENSYKLSQVTIDLNDISQINFQDKITIKDNIKKELNTLKKYLEDLHQNLNQGIESSKTLLNDYTKKKDANIKAKEQFAVLKEIPLNDTKEWKEFIVAGEKYSNKLNLNRNICPYCHQPLKDNNSIDIVQAYCEFLKDDSEKELKTSVQNIAEKKKYIDKLSTSLQITENLQSFLEDYKLEDSNESLFKIILDLNAKLEKTKIKIVLKLNNKDFDSDIELTKAKTISSKLDLLMTNLQEEINKLSENESKKKEKIEELNKIKSVLEENKSISEQKNNINKWFEVDAIELMLKNKSSEINTKQISDLSKIVNNKLLTENLKQNFMIELNEFGYSNLKVNLENAGIKKGVSNTKLTLIKNNDLKAILSEGEQKAVGLALFIAEAKIQKSNNPIILDDPINSLDHRIASKFAERLLKLENQIIIFNHNKLFLDNFETSKENHVCKTIDTDCCCKRGKHIRIFKVISEGINAKGVLSNYMSNKSKTHLDEAKNLGVMDIFNGFFFTLLSNGHF